MANQHNNLATMSRSDFEKYCEAQSDEWKVEKLYKTLHDLAKSKENCQVQNKQILHDSHEIDSYKHELDILRNKTDKCNFLLKKVGYNPRKLLVYYKESGVRDFICNHCCERDCFTCENHYEQDCINTFVLYDFYFYIGTTYDDFDGFEHSVLEGIDVNLDDVCLQDVTKIVDLDTNKVLFEKDGDN
jgi:hypothetical protein